MLSKNYLSMLNLCNGLHAMVQETSEIRSAEELVNFYKTLVPEVFPTEHFEMRDKSLTKRQLLWGLLSRCSTCTVSL